MVNREVVAHRKYDQQGARTKSKPESEKRVKMSC